MNSHIPAEILSVELQANSMLSIIQKKKELIGKNEHAQKPLQASYEQYSKLEEENKRLTKEIEQDYKAIKQIIEFTEKNCGYIIETTPLFDKIKESN